MGKHVILTEDTTCGREFYQLLVDSGVFIAGTIVMDSSYGQQGKQVSGGPSNAKSAIEQLLQDKILQSGDTLILVLDVRLPTRLVVNGNKVKCESSSLMERQELVENEKLNSILSTLKKINIKIVRVRAFC